MIRMRRICIIGTVALGMALTAAWMPHPYCRIVTSAHSFSHYFRDLKQADDTLSPLQRFVFSLVLANERPHPGSHHHS